jgi:deoxyribodipyrimidine photolyase-related protein
MQHAVVIYPHQLFKTHPALSANALVYLVEDPLYFTQYRFHVQKIVLHRASMKAYETKLTKARHEVRYVECHELPLSSDIGKILDRDNITSVTVCDVTDDWLDRAIREACAVHDITLTIVYTPMFLTSMDALEQYKKETAGRKKFLMKHFYEWQRKRLNILIDETGRPTGGAWSFDTENRKKIPAKLLLPKDPTPGRFSNAHVEEARAYQEAHFGGNYGTTDTFWYPVTHEQAEVWLEEFIAERLTQFGPYEDAITTRGRTLFHSVLSPLLNIGLLTPQQVVAAALEAHVAKQFPLASLEGFIRQVIGWREYLRAVYVFEGRSIRTKNYFSATRKIPESLWTGTTGLLALDDTISSVLDTAYAHHIPRLMIMGNYMTLCGFLPNHVYRWFMELFIDAYDWVMVPNVYSMALYADGGTITTKPYISGSRYIVSMSDYPKSEWCELWDALFWHFVHTHYDKLKVEARLSMMTMMLDKMDNGRKEALLTKAAQYLQSLDV